MGITSILTALGLSFFAAMPATSNYQLNSYGFGSGGVANSGTATYSLEGISGELSGQTQATSAYSTKPGFIETQQAAVPKLASFTNPADYTNKLHFAIEASQASSIDIVIIVGDPAVPTTGDSNVKTMLEGLGYTATYKDDNDAEDYTGKEGVVMLDSSSAATVGNKYRTATVPVVTHEDGNFDDLAFVVNRSTTSFSSIVIDDDTHAIADGPYGSFTGTVSIYPTTYLSGKGDTPGPGAEVVASLNGGADKTIIAYDTGDTMTGSFTAPARRVMVPFKDLAMTDLTTNGENLLKNTYTWAFGTPSSGAPSDTLYALQISTTSDFSSNVNYVKSDLTIGPTLTLADYQTYTAWGGASGVEILGLTSNTTYYLRAKATNGKFTESGYGPSLSAATVGSAELSFTLSTTSINMGSLIANTVVDAPQAIDVSITTNASSGSAVYINGQNSGLNSTAASSTINSATGNLSSLSSGFGAIISSVNLLTKESPYDGTGNSVGITDASIRKIFSTTGAVTNGTGSVLLKAKSDISNKPASDYTEILTMLASASF